MKDSQQIKGGRWYMPKWVKPILAAAAIWAIIIAGLALMSRGATNLTPVTTRYGFWQYSFTDTAVLAGATSDTFYLPLFMGNNAWGGYMLMTVGPDTNNAAVTLTATDSIYVLVYEEAYRQAGTVIYAAKPDTVLFNGFTNRTAGLDYDVESWYNAWIGGIINPLSGNSGAMFIFKNVSSGNDSVDVPFIIYWK